jgi:NADPH:quinone reductase-like Zn-dependent oxidoreductase
MTMRAVVFERYGPPKNLSLREVEKPLARPDEILVKVRAAGVNPQDWHCLRGTPLLARLLVGGLLRPGHRILGSDVAGTVEAIGAHVTRFGTGDDVLGMSFRHGAFAEYMVFPESGVIAPMPSGLSFEEAASVPMAGAMALMGLRDQAKVKARNKVLVNGASGGIGTFAVQIGKALGAPVTGVCSTRNLDLVRSLGADRAIDYTQVDFTREDVRYDVIFDVVAKRTFLDCRRVLAPQGIYVTTAVSPGLMLQSLWIALASSERLKPMLQKPRTADLNALTDMIEAGRLRPVIDRRYTLSEVQCAIAYVEEGHARGKVIIEMEE